MKTRKKLVRIILGWTSLVTGLLGLVLPVVPGTLLLAIGVILLAPEVPLFGRILEKLRKRYPKIARKAEKMADDLGG